MDTTREKGSVAEEIAIDYLKKNGYEILEQNWYNSHQELDIIARKNKIVAIIEVKSLSSNYIREPYQSVNRNKQRLIISATNAYIRKHNINDDVQFDIISIIMGRNAPQIEHIENAFLSNGKMNIEEFRKYCISKKGVTEEFPFGENTLVYKVMGKMFALTSLDGDFTINLKCDPELAIELREQYPAVLPGYHMNKMHWNTVVIDGSVSNKLIYQWTDHSYNLVVDHLTKTLKINSTNYEPKKYSRLNYLMKKITSYFLQGLLYSAPIGITLFVIYSAFLFVDGFLKTPIEAFLNIHIPGLGVVLMVIFITLVGIIGQSVVAQPFKAAVERLIQKAPFLHMVYTSIRDFMEAFVGKEKKFNQPVSVLVNKDPEIERFGFITQHDLSEIHMKGKVAVYIPLSYGFMGELLIVPAENVKLVDMPAGEMMKFIVSGSDKSLEYIKIVPKIM